MAVWCMDVCHTQGVSTTLQDVWVMYGTIHQCMAPYIVYGVAGVWPMYGMYGACVGCARRVPRRARPGRAPASAGQQWRIGLGVPATKAAPSVVGLRVGKFTRLDVLGWNAVQRGVLSRKRQLLFLFLFDSGLYDVRVPVHRLLSFFCLFHVLNEIL